jgi:phosphoribosylformylglycinamidine synthase
LHDTVRGTPPWIDLAVERNVQRVCRDAIRDGLIRSAHDVSEGGLAVALAECCISGPGVGFGAEIEMEGELRPDAWLFGESQSRVVLSVRRRHLGRIRELAESMQVPFTVLGEVKGRRLRIGELIDADVAELRATWTNALPRRMASAGGDDARQVP